MSLSHPAAVDAPPAREASSSSAPTGQVRLLVGLGGSPFATRLLDAAHDLARSTGAAWFAVHVETPYLLSADDQRRLDADLTRARELGAEIVVTRDLEIAPALLRVARERHITHLIVGQSSSRRVFGWRRRTLAERLVRDGGDFSVHILPSDPQSRGRWFWRLAVEPSSYWWEYGLVGLVIAATTAAGILAPPISHVAIGLIYLLGVIVLSLWVGRWPVLLAGVLSALVWEYVFIPPRFAIAIATTEDALLFGTYFVVALVAGQLTARIRTQAKNERLREEHATALLQLTRILAEAASFDDAVATALRKVETLFGARTLLWLARERDAACVPHPASGYVAAGEDATALRWTLDQVQPAGRFTRSVPHAQGFYLPLRIESRAVGALGVKVAAGQALPLGHRDLVEAFARQLALLIEREHLRASSEREQLLAASEKLHRSLFDSVSHELRTPLAVIDAAVDNLIDADDSAREKVVDEIRIAVRRLNRLVRNLLDQTRLESGALRPRLDWCSARDLVNSALDGTRDALADRPVNIAIPDELPPIRADFALTEHALMNLVLNAAYHTPAGSPITVSAHIGDGRACFLVADRGAGFPVNVRERLFKKFSRGDSARAGGLGLGLSIVRGLVNAQGGDVAVADNPGGGAVVTITLPHPETHDRPAHE